MFLGFRIVSMSSLALVVTSAFRVSGILGLGCLGELYITPSFLVIPRFSHGEERKQRSLARSNPASCTPLGVSVAICSLELLAILLSNLCDLSCFCGNIKGTRPCRYSANVCTSIFELRRHNGFYDVPRLESVLEVLRFWISTRKTVPTHQAHLPTPMPISPNCQWSHTSHLQSFWSGFAHTNRVYPMGFGQFLHRPVVLGESSRTTLDR